MKLSNRFQLLVALFLLGVCGAHAQNSNVASVVDGSIVEQAPYALPSYEQFEDRFKQAYSKASVEKIKNSSNLELPVVTGRSKRKRMNGDVVVVTGQVRFTRVWAKLGAVWQVVAAQSTPITPQ